MNQSANPEDVESSSTSMAGIESAIRNVLGNLVSFFGPALGSVFLIPRAWIGALLWLGLAQNMRYAAFAVVGVVIAGGIGRSLRVNDALQLGGGLRANALLTSVAVSWLTEPIAIALPIQLGIAAASAACACIVAAAIARALKGTSLPSLVWAYALVAEMLFILFPQWTYAAIQATPPLTVPHDAVGWLSEFFRSWGALLFSPRIEVGIIVAVAILLWSRAIFLTGLIGWITGVATAVVFEKLGVSYFWLPAAYNFFLAGMALGAIFFLPGRTCLIRAAAGGCGASFFGVVLQHLFQGSSFAFLPVSSALTIWIGISALTLAGERTMFWRNDSTDLPPEEAWWRAVYWSKRSGRHEPLLVVPVSGVVQVSQGFGGALSHVNLWQHALDFQRPQPTASTSEADRSIWGAPVLTPAAGIVERVRNDIADNPLGISNYAENWGNYVMIRLDQGGWAMLAHLQQGTVVVSPGARVEIGTFLGRVGSSGRSPIPHLHLQVQSAPNLGAPTIPFRLANYRSATRSDEPVLNWNETSVPAAGTIVMASLPVPGVHAVLTSMAPGSAVWSVESQGRIPRPFRQVQSGTLRVKSSLDPAGRHLFKSESDTLVSVLDPDAWRVIELKRTTSPFIKLLALAAPSIPYGATVGMTWTEPVMVVRFPVASWFGLLLAPYLKDPFTHVRSKCVSAPDSPSGTVTIESTLDAPGYFLPSKLTSEFELLRGPVKIVVTFERGTLTYSLLSFEPAASFGSDDAA